MLSSAPRPASCVQFPPSAGTWHFPLENVIKQKKHSAAISFHKSAAACRTVALTTLHRLLMDGASQPTTVNLGPPEPAWTHAGASSSPQVDRVSASVRTINTDLTCPHTCRIYCPTWRHLLFLSELFRSRRWVYFPLIVLHVFTMVSDLKHLLLPGLQPCAGSRAKAAPPPGLIWPRYEKHLVLYYTWKMLTPFYIFLHPRHPRRDQVSVLQRETCTESFKVAANQP